MAPLRCADTGVIALSSEPPLGARSLCSDHSPALVAHLARRAEATAQRRPPPSSSDEPRGPAGRRASNHRVTAGGTADRPADRRVLVRAYAPMPMSSRPPANDSPFSTGHPPRSRNGRRLETDRVSATPGRRCARGPSRGCGQGSARRRGRRASSCRVCRSRKGWEQRVA